MKRVVAEQELYQACRIIFGPDLRVSREFLEYIQFSGVKSAFRKKAMETHPDRLPTLDELAKKRSAQMFHVVQQAYEKLMHYLEAREKGFRFQRSIPASSTAGRTAGPNRKPQRNRPRNDFTRQNGFARPQWDAAGKARSDYSHHTLYRGPIPQRKLLFGHYLYYAGQVNWQTVIKALIWQKAQRPQLGEMARQHGWLTSEEILFILKRGISSRLSFGQQALQLGLLNQRKLHQLLREQQLRHKKIGEFFIHQNILTPAQVQLLLFRFQRHNTSFARTRPDWIK